MRIAFCYAPIYVLGPGERYGVWVQGCTRGCLSCMAKSLQPRDGGYESAPLVLSRSILQSCTANFYRGVTISGGEPFEQPNELKTLLEFLNHYGIKDILIYSGFSIGTLLQKFPWVATLCACVVDGHFAIDQPTEDAWRGSANQSYRLFRQMPGYEGWFHEQKGRLQTVRNGNNVYVLGIPRIGDADVLTGKINGTYAPVSGLRQ